MPLLTPAVARRVGRRWLVLGDGKLRLPLVYLDDVVDAVESALDGPLAGGEVIQLVDPLRLTQDEVLSMVLPPGARVMHVPRLVLFTVGKISELALGLVKRKSPLSAYRLRSALARVGFAPGRAGELLGWEPRVGVVEGIRRSVSGAQGGDAPRVSP